MLYSIAAILVLVLDQAVKFWTVRNIPPQAIDDACVNLIPGVIHMTNVQNYGAAFSILENARWILVAVSALFIIGIIVLVSMDIIHTKFGRWTAILVMAGALGNCIDRVLLGYVVDMFEFELFNFAVFNVADIFITVCGILFCIHVIIYREPEAERNAVPRPVKQKKGRRAPQPEEYDDYDDGYDEYEDEEPRRPAKAKGGRKSRKEDAYPAAPRRGRRNDEDDPFAEWEDEDDLDDFDEEPAPRARNKAAAKPAPQAEKPAARTRRPAADEPAPKASGRRTAVTVDDDWDDYAPDVPARRPSAPAPAPAKRPAPAPAKSAKPAPKPADSWEDNGGFEDYSLEDILSEFRDL